MRTNFTCSTNGRGLWSEAVRAVTITKLVADAMKDVDNHEWGELQAFFDPTDWDTSKHGLIYTDKQFKAEFRTALRDLGFSEAACDNVGYSEMGMQGRDYVSFDIGGVFLAEFRRISKEAVVPVVL